MSDNLKVPQTVTVRASRKAFRKPVDEKTVTKLREIGCKTDVFDKNNDIDLRGYRFIDQDLSGLDFSNINIQGAHFNNVNLSRTNLSDNDLTWCSFIDTIQDTNTLFPRNIEALKQSKQVRFESRNP